MDIGGIPPHQFNRRTPARLWRQHPPTGPRHEAVGKSTVAVADTRISSPSRAVVQNHIHLAVAVQIFQDHLVVSATPEQRLEVVSTVSVSEADISESSM